MVVSIKHSMANSHLPMYDCPLPRVKPHPQANFSVAKYNVILNLDAMEEKGKLPPTETTKDDSSDVEQVKELRQGPLPEKMPKEENPPHTLESEEAQKGHS